MKHLVLLVSLISLFGCATRESRFAGGPRDGETLGEPMQLEMRLGVNVAIEEVFSGEALAEANRAVGIGEDEAPRLMIWSADLQDHFGQRDVQLVSIEPRPTETVVEPENGNRIFLWDLTPELVAGRTLKIERVYRLKTSTYDPPEYLEGKYLIWAKTSADAMTAKPAIYTVVSKDTLDFYTKTERFEEATPQMNLAARSATGLDKEPMGRAREIFRFVRGHMTYEYPPPGGRGAAIAFECKKGDCGQYADLFVTMCRSVGVPTRMAAGFHLFPKKDAPGEFTVGSHAWAELLRPDGVWVPVDATGEEEMFFGRKGENTHITASVGRNIPLPDVPEGAKYSFSEVEDGRTDLMQAYTEYRSGFKGRVTGFRTARIVE